MLIKKFKKLYLADTYEKGLYIFENEIIEVFKSKYPTYMKYLNSKKDECLAFLNYPESIRKLINNTNPVESVHSTFEKQRIKKGGFFQSMDTLNVALFIATNKLHQKWKINPLIKSKIYELNQIFVKKFGKGVIK